MLYLFYSQRVTQHVVPVPGRVALSAWRVHTPVTCSTRAGASTRVGRGSFYSRASVLVSMQRLKMFNFQSPFSCCRDIYFQCEYMCVSV